MCRRSAWWGVLFAASTVVWLGACGGQSARKGSTGGAAGSGSGADAGVSATGGTPPSSNGGTSTAGQGASGGVSGDDFGGEAGAPTIAGAGGIGGTGGTTNVAGSSAGGTSAGEGNEPAGFGGAAGDPGGQGGASGGDGPLECNEDCSALDATCFFGSCDTELGRCQRWPINACRSGDGCCPSLCAQDNDDDCTSQRVVLAPAHSGNRSEDGALGAATFAGVQDGRRSFAFFAFDLSGITGTITSAQLDLHFLGYESPDPDETFVVRSVATDIQALVDPAARVDVFDDLQAGAYYFSTGMAVEHVGSIVPMELGHTELGDLNAKIGSYWSFGIAAEGTLGDRSAVEGIVFSDGVNAPLERLTLVVEPAAEKLDKLGR
jgi:hypothetical protein